MKKKLVMLLTICGSISLAACGEQGSGRGSLKDAEEIAVSDEVSETAQTEDKKETTEETEPEKPAASEEGRDTDPAPTEEPTPEAVESDDEPWVSGDLVFDTVDINGNAVTDEVIRGSKLVLLNLWEPWCGPCVNEMPDLQELYENYKDQGLIILGAYTTFQMDGDAKEIVDSIGITYPILKADDNLLSYEQDYVPATFLFDGSGNLLSSEPIAGSQSYRQWEKVVQENLPE